jgi:hypothetical protein
MRLDSQLLLIIAKLLTEKYGYRLTKKNTRTCLNESLNSQAKTGSIRYSWGMAGIHGRSAPPNNLNAFRHGIAGIAQRRADGFLNPQEQSIREEILSGLLADKGRSGADQHRHARAGGDHRK